MCFIYSCLFLTDKGYISVDELKKDDVLLDEKGKRFAIKNLYKLPEYKVIKMVRIKAGAMGDLPNRNTYLKPTQYLKMDDCIIRARDLVEKYGTAEYERFNILNFFLINVEPKDNGTDINEFVDCNGLQVSVYNQRHPLNNRFKRFGLGTGGNGCLRHHIPPIAP